MTESAQRFEAGTFAPAPRRNSVAAMLIAQTKLELTLLLRNGEQLLLTMIIPITLLVGLSLLPFIPVSGAETSSTAGRVNQALPGVLMVAVMSTAFTGQAIAVGFDRRYGALKRLGATALPRWGIIGGKSLAVAAVVALQVAILSGVGFALGWRTTPAGCVFALVLVLVGTVCFSALGLWLGGTLKAEVVLALANILWFAMLILGALAISDAQSAMHSLLRHLPSGALAHGMNMATQYGRLDVVDLAVLLLWAGAGGAAAARWFRFS